MESPDRGGSSLLASVGGRKERVSGIRYRNLDVKGTMIVCMAAMSLDSCKTQRSNTFSRMDRKSYQTN